MKLFLKSKSIKKVIALLFCIFSLFCLTTIAYSALSSTMNITGVAISRVETDVRITDFKIETMSNDVVSQYEEFSKNSIASNITFSSSSSSITYKVQITNYGNNNIGISTITGMKDGLSYELLDYSLKDKLCDNSGKCTNHAVKEFYIKIIGNQGTHDINLFFEFKPFYNITYTNIVNNNYPQEILSDENLVVDIGINNASAVLVYFDGIFDEKYIYKDGILRIASVENNIEVKGVSESKNFDYTGTEETYTIPYDGIYKLETWGAQGGYGLENGSFTTARGGYGSYSTGEIYLKKDEILYINIGGKGNDGKINYNATGGYNGGGNSWWDNNDNESSGAGGGASHISKVSGKLSALSQYEGTCINQSSQCPILIVSGGGGGGAWIYPGGEAGGYIGSESNNIANSSGTQTSGYKFGEGEAGNRNTATPGGGGGGGLYGGLGGPSDARAGSGGSGYIANPNLTNKYMTCYNCATSNEEATKTLKITNVSSTPTSQYAKTGNGYAKISLVSMNHETSENIEITNFLSSETNDAISKNETYTISSIYSNITLNSENSFVVYEIDITNYGTANMGILSIEGLQSSLQYELLNYNLEEKLCDENGLCNNNSTKKLYLKLTGTPGDYNINLTFKFNPFYTIKYTNITTSNYPTEIFGGKDININFNLNQPPGILVKLGGTNTDNYTYKDGTLNIINVRSNIEIIGINSINEYNYTGSSQTFTTPYSGIYKVELWGAAGGGDLVQGILYKNNVGLGGYTSGEIYLNKNEQLYVYVGERGGDPVAYKNSKGGYNGGGQGSHDNSDDETSGGGGGATDIRLVSGVWNDSLSLKSRIMVAAGGASEKMYDIPLANIITPVCTAGGGLVGYTMLSTSPPPTQTTGYAFGIGQDGIGGSSDAADGGGNSGLGGGGGGYYGGIIANTDHVDAASGGSSFISGHNGCVAIESSSSTTPRKDSSGNKCDDGTIDITCSYHYSGYKFANTIMIDGAGYNWTTSKGSKIGMPTFDGTSTMTGSTGNGYAKITLIEMIKE